IKVSSSSQADERLGWLAPLPLSAVPGASRHPLTMTARSSSLLPGQQARSTTYDAFISYSHARDGPVAEALQRALHRLAKRWYQIRALRAFRDKNSLSASPNLWMDIERALRHSRYFLLMASPEAATSPWVQKEIAFWQKNRTPETFLVVVTNGHLEWNPSAEDFDWSRTTALPRQLSGWFAAEPLWVQLDGARRDTQLSLRNTEFRAAVCRLGAPIHDKPPDELDSEDIRQYRIASRAAPGNDHRTEFIAGDRRDAWRGGCPAAQRSS
ncbi:MAG: toll/interleukin-1 receptor domain-containing protein, partial [Candidatus Dormibacteraceae bacterium]